MGIKKITIMVMMLVCGLSLFANGQADETGNKENKFQDLLKSGEKVALTGALTLDNRIMPELTVGNVVYTLMVPRHLVFQLDIEDGEQVSIEGVIIKPDQNNFPQCKRFSANAKIVIVTKATIKGKTYDLEKEYGKIGPRGYMHGGKGPRKGNCPITD